MVSRGCPVAGCRIPLGARARELTAVGLSESLMLEADAVSGTSGTP
jgi:hypothetical protein